METTTKETEMRYEVEIDTALAQVHGELAKCSQALAGAADSLRYQVGAKKIYRTRSRYEWSMTVTEAEVAAQKLIEENPNELSVYVPGSGWSEIRILRSSLEKLQVAREQKQEILHRLHALEEKYTGWSRFFLVNNVNGHIHSSMNCSTCRFDTSFSWLPTLSGLTEAEAVAEHGAILCTVCFPSAPVEWTNGHEIAAAEKDADKCNGTVDPATVTYAGYNNKYGEGRCSCGKWGRMTREGTLRKHKPGS